MYKKAKDSYLLSITTVFMNKYMGVELLDSVISNRRHLEAVSFWHRTVSIGTHRPFSELFSESTEMAELLRLRKVYV